MYVHVSYNFFNLNIIEICLYILICTTIRPNLVLQNIYSMIYKIFREHCKIMGHIILFMNFIITGIEMNLLYDSEFILVKKKYLIQIKLCVSIGHLHKYFNLFRVIILTSKICLRWKCVILREIYNWKNTFKWETIFGIMKLFIFPSCTITMLDMWIYHWMKFGHKLIAPQFTLLWYNFFGFISCLSLVCLVFISHPWNCCWFINILNLQWKFT